MFVKARICREFDDYSLFIFKIMILPLLFLNRVVPPISREDTAFFQSPFSLTHSPVQQNFKFLFVFVIQISGFFVLSETRD